MTIDGLLESYRDVFALTEAEKGAKFERLMKNFLLTYPVWRNKISRVWRWHEFPFRDQLGGVDLGIDLVAETFNGEFWAAQCKFYADTSTVTKEAVDSFISNATRTFNGGKTFSRLFWISTTDRYTKHAREMLKGRTPEVKIIDLAFLRRAQVNWTLLDNGFVRKEAVTIRKLRDYQQTAVDKAREHFGTHDRGQLIMACGTGKTFTALKIAETLSPDGKILFLVPSISLLGQTLDEWASNAEKPIDAVCVCSDATASNVDDDIVDVNLPLDAMTDPDKISAALETFTGDGLTVVFSTYQSIEVVHELGLTFDLVVCDEAHRTASSKDSHFTAVHDENFIHARKRLYMTATPKLPKIDAKDSDDEEKLSEWTMNNKAKFGKEFYRISFREAIARGCLSDYKVFVLTVNERDLNSELRKFVDDTKSPLTADEVLKLIGCINALSKNMDSNSAKLIADDPQFMRTAVAFNRKIKDSVRVAENFRDVQLKYTSSMSAAEKSSLVTIDAKHVDGTMPSAERNGKLHWLKSAPENVCRVLNNVRCLSEGIDVPALDAIIFLSSRKSKVEIVQAVGRVMRPAPGKKFGYIIIPAVVPLGSSPEEALNNSADYSTVWDVVNALRAHDDAMNVEIERIRNNGKSERVIVATERNHPNDDPQLDLLHLLRWDDLRDKIYARMVEHVGNKLYWIQWAHKVADIVERHTKRIANLIDTDQNIGREFYNFVYALQKNLNPSVKPKDAIDMLAQHLVTRPVFEALFENYNFVKQNPVSQSMQKILDVLDDETVDKDRETFDRLYQQVRESCSNMGDAASRQRIIIRLYDSFFKIALKKTADKLGIVYTPVEVVDFILRSVDAVLHKHFNRRLTSRGVHVIDPFTGTGTFITRLIESGLIRPADLERKYLHELHANEIVLLAYYIAAVNIENAFAARADTDAYKPFAGICFTDTFQLYERGQSDLPLEGVMKVNSARVNLQKDTRIEVIVGNPPYRVGQESANEDNKNLKYDNLKKRIEYTYAKHTDASNKSKLYDSYIKAFRWASDRLGDGGVIGFITNAGWIEADSMDGLRKCFVKEFSAIYIFNLRGDITGKEKSDSEREGENVFDIKTGVAITILVKDSAHVGDAQIFYRDIGDYLKREQKFDILNRTFDVLDDGFEVIVPNRWADWINQRGELFYTFPAIGDKNNLDNAETFFCRWYSKGVNTARDAWAYNFSQPAVETNMQTTIDYYNTHKATDIDPTKFVWNDSSVQNKNRERIYTFDAAQIVESVYRPFCKQHLYFDGWLNERVYQMPKLFPKGSEDNLLICVTGPGSKKNFSVFIVNKIPCLDMIDKSQCFPLYWYGDNSTRRDGVTDWILRRARELYGNTVTKADIFYYVYGFLHLPKYREDFANNLRHDLPRIFLVDDAQKFWQLSKAGRKLADLHLNYERQPAPEGVEVVGAERGNFHVTKLRFASKDDRTILIYNSDVTIRNIPPRSFEYVVNGRSPLEWIIDRYQIKRDKASGLVNDANDWGNEHGNPRYILDLILSCLTVSLRTLDIVDALPEIDFDA